MSLLLMGVGYSKKRVAGDPRDVTIKKFLPFLLTEKVGFRVVLSRISEGDHSLINDLFDLLVSNSDLSLKNNIINMFLVITKTAYGESMIAGRVTGDQIKPILEILVDQGADKFFRNKVGWLINLFVVSKNKLVRAKLVKAVTDDQIDGMVGMLVKQEIETLSGHEFLRHGVAFLLLELSMNCDIAKKITESVTDGKIKPMLEILLDQGSNEYLRKEVALLLSVLFMEGSVIDEVRKAVTDDQIDGMVGMLGKQDVGVDLRKCAAFLLIGLSMTSCDKAKKITGSVTDDGLKFMIGTILSTTVNDKGMVFCHFRYNIACLLSFFIECGDDQQKQLVSFVDNVDDLVEKLTGLIKRKCDHHFVLEGSHQKLQNLKGFLDGLSKKRKRECEDAAKALVGLSKSRKPRRQC